MRKGLTSKIHGVAVSSLTLARGPEGALALSDVKLYYLYQAPDGTTQVAGETILRGQWSPSVLAKAHELLDALESQAASSPVFSTPASKTIIYEDKDPSGIL